jgi:hypothetical protein
MVIGLPLAAGGAGAVAGEAPTAVLAAGAEPPVVTAGDFAGAVFEAALPHATTSPTSSKQASRCARRRESKPPPYSHLAIGCSLAARPPTSKLPCAFPP